MDNNQFVESTVKLTLCNGGRMSTEQVRKTLPLTDKELKLASKVRTDVEKAAKLLVSAKNDARKLFSMTALRIDDFDSNLSVNPVTMELEVRDN
jgi:hypothetical protein